MSGLVLYIDSANSVSYPGSGALWRDVSGQGNNFAMTGTMTYTSGYFTSTATIANYWSIANYNHPTTLATMEMWVQCNVGSATDGIWSYASTGSTNDNIMFDQSNLTLFGPAGASAISGIAINDGVWRNLVRVSNRITGDELLYINGSLVFSANLSPGVSFTPGGVLILGQEQDAIGGGLDPNQALEGNYSVFKMYNRLLSADEVLQNFNALRGRYSI